jgi:hypothetical protein
MRTSFKRVKDPEAKLQIRCGVPVPLEDRVDEREAAKGKRVWNLERENQSLEGESSEGKSQGRYGAK